LAKKSAVLCPNSGPILALGVDIKVASLSEPTPDARLQSAWRDGKIVIIATLAEGPNAGGEVMCITKRTDVNSGIRRVRRKDLHRNAHFMESVRTAIRAAVRKGISSLSPSNDQDFMNDLCVLMSVKCVAGESALDGSGLFSLLMAVNPDESVPWTRRGLLAPGDADAKMAERV
jgi:hypothetical protein